MQPASFVVLFVPLFQILHQEKQKSLHYFQPGGTAQTPSVALPYSQDIYTALWECSWDLYRFQEGGFSAFAITEPGQGICMDQQEFTYSHSEYESL